MTETADGLGVAFEGWFQCRVPSDPDPPDEPRGVSGCTFAMVGEPDLDQIIRFQPPNQKLIRSHSPDIGVRVVSVTLGGKTTDEHPLVGATVELVGEAKFIEMNGVVVDRNTAFIDPFDLKITADDGMVIRRQAAWTPSPPEGGDFYDLPPSAFKVRQPLMLEKDSPEVMEATKMNPATYKDDRLALLQHDLENEEDELIRSGIEQRIHNLQLTDWRGFRLTLLVAARILYNFTLNAGEFEVKDPAAALGGTPSSAEWPIELWMGGWDNDTLCGFTRGRVMIPFDGAGQAET